MTKIEDLQEKIIKEQETQIKLLNRLLMQEQVKRAQDFIKDTTIICKEEPKTTENTCGENILCIIVVIIMILWLMKVYELLF